jgi:hypothetical protein
VLVDVPVNARTETHVSEAGRESKATALDVWRSATSLGEIVLKKDGDVLRARLERPEPALPPGVTIRLEETLSFILGAHVRWEVEQTLSAGTFQILLRSGIQPQRKPRLRPPIERNMIDANLDRALLLDRVLTFLTSTAANDGEYHPLAQILLRVLRASGTGIEDEALVLSTAVESVVQSNFKPLLKPASALVVAIDSALTHIEQWSGPSEVLERIKGAVRRIKEANASEALRKLEASGVLRAGQTQKWRELRNPAAHGARSPRDIQGFVARCDVVNDLLTRLVFELVGFKGRYTDHTTRGWPLASF